MSQRCMQVGLIPLRHLWYKSVETYQQFRRSFWKAHLSINGWYTHIYVDFRSFLHGCAIFWTLTTSNSTPGTTCTWHETLLNNCYLLLYRYPHPILLHWLLWWGCIKTNKKNSSARYCRVQMTVSFLFLVAAAFITHNHTNITAFILGKPLSYYRNHDEVWLTLKTCSIWAPQFSTPVE